MAMTGGAAYLVKSERTNYGSNSWTTDLYIYVKVISQNVVANTSTIALGMYVYSQYSIAWSDFGTNGTSYIGTATSGANCFTFTNGQSGSGTKWLVEDKQVTVSHNSNGTLTLPIYWHWGVNSPWGQYTGPSGSYNVTLSTIDRVAPTVTFSVSSITANGFKISANSTSTADIWQYSTNGGSTWMTFSTSASTSASVTLSSLSPNTNYTVKVRARRQYNQVYGTSGGSTVKTLGGAVVNSVSTVTADNARVTITINVTVYEPSYINSLAIKSGNTTLLTVTGLAWTKGTANRSVTLSSAQRTTLLNWMASIKSFTGTFAVSSFSGSTQIGSTSSKTATVQTTAANSAPTLSDFTYEDSYAVTKSITENNQLFIQDCSTLKVTPGTATAKNGASISNYTAACNGLSASSSSGSAITLGKITKSGSVIVTLTVVDSRGYTATLTKTITVIPYSAPKMYSATLRRTNDIEPEMQLKFSGSIAAISVNGTQKNSVVYARYRYKKTSDADYSGFTSIIAGLTQSGTSFSYSNLELCNLDANSSYDFQLQIQDKLYSQSSLDLYFVVPQGTPLIALRKKKVGINTPNPQAALDVAGDMRVSGGLRVGGASLADFVIQQGTSGIWSFRKWKSGMAECWGAYNFTVAITSAWGAVYESGLISLPTFPFTFAAIPTVFFSSGNGNAAFSLNEETARHEQLPQVPVSSMRCARFRPAQATTKSPYTQSEKCDAFLASLFYTQIQHSKEDNNMKEFWTTIQVAFAAVGGWLGWFMGGCDGLLYALLAFVVLDYITGVMCAIVDHKLSSEIGFKGIFKKLLIFELVGIGHIIDAQVIGNGSVLRTAVIFFYISNEGISLIENAGHLGLPIPEKLKSVLEQLHDRAEREDK